MRLSWCYRLPSNSVVTQRGFTQVHPSVTMSTPRSESKCGWSAPFFWGGRCYGQHQRRKIVIYSHLLWNLDILFESSCWTVLEIFRLPASLSSGAPCFLRLRSTKRAARKAWRRNKRSACAGKPLAGQPCPSLVAKSRCGETTWNEACFFWFIPSISMPT